MLLAAFLLVFAIQAQQGQVDRIKNFKIPEYHATTGELESIIHGGEALFNRQTKVADIQQLRIEIFKNDKIETVVTSAACLYDQRTGSATGETDIKIHRDNVTVTGTGYTWNKTAQTFEIRANARVELRNASKNVQLSPKESQDARPTPTP